MPRLALASAAAGPKIPGQNLGIFEKFTKFSEGVGDPPHTHTWVRGVSQIGQVGLVGPVELIEYLGSI